MIRRTVARAFGGSPSGKAGGPWPGDDAAGSAAIERFLRDLHRALEEIVTGGAGAGSLESAGPPDARLRLNRPETLPEGIEFALAGPGAAVRFLDTLLGFVRVIIAGREGETVEEVLSLHPHAGAQRPVWKPAWFNAGYHPALNHAFHSPILPLPNSPSRVAPEAGPFLNHAWKPLAGPTGCSSRPTAGGRRRTAFRFTSVADLADRYSAIASGVHRG